MAILVLATSAHAAWQTPAAPSASAPSAVASRVAPVGAQDGFYKISPADIAAAIAKQLQAQDIEAKAEVMLAPGTPPVVYSADHAVTLALHGVQVDPNSKRWQAQVHFMANGKSESVKPFSGTYGTLVDVPVVTRQLSKLDVIEKGDITLVATPQRLLRKDTVTDPAQLIGQSPRNGISANRPIHANEISAPIMVKRGDMVEMAYNTPYIQIKTTGVALEDGAKGAAIRVKNQKSQIAVAARVDGSGKVSVNNGQEQ